MKLVDRFFRGYFLLSLLLVASLAFARFSYRGGGVWEVVNPDGGILNLGTTGDTDIELATKQSSSPVGWTIDSSAGGKLVAKNGTEGIRVGSGLLRNIYTVTDNDAQDNTLTVAELVGGITVHTSTTGGGTVTTDTAANIIAGNSGVGALDTNGECYTHLYINDGDQTLTFAGGTNVTIADTGETIATNEAAILYVCRTSSSAVTVYIVGA